MINSSKEKVCAIVPALNEEANVGNVLRVLLDSNIFDQVILVDDGSIDKTAEIGEKLGVRVIRLSKIGGNGKGNAMKQGIKSTDAKIIAFFDADLIGLSKEHITLLVEPMFQRNLEMCIGIRNHPLSLRESIIKIDSMLAISGARVVKKRFVDKIPEKYFNGFSIETILNYYCFRNNLKIKYVLLDRLDHVIKEKKWGLIKGFTSRMGMVLEIIKIRIIFIINKNEFIQKNNSR